MCSSTRQTVRYGGRAVRHFKPCQPRACRLQRLSAESVLNTLKQRPDSWRQVDIILDTSTNVKSKFFALSILEDTILTRWKSLPAEQREAVRTFVVSKIITVRVSGVGRAARPGVPSHRTCSACPTRCVAMRLR